MNISKENIDDLNAVLKIDVVQDDYTEKVETVLKDYRRKVALDGFRKGKVPFGLVKKMYGKAVLVEEINKIVSDALSDFIFENKLNVLGEPLPSKDHKPIDFDNDDSFEFRFDIGMAPTFEIKLSKKDKVNFYNIIVDDTMLDRQIEAYTKRYGNVDQKNETAEKSIIKGRLVQLEGKEEATEGIVREGAIVSVERVKDKKIQKALCGLKIGDSADFDLMKAFDSEAEVAGLLGLKKEELVSDKMNYRIAVEEITEYTDAELDQALFDKVFGEGSVKGLEEFRSKVKEEISQTLLRESDYRFVLDAKDKVLEKIDAPLPEEFLKRWLLATNNNNDLTEERLEKEFPIFMKDLKWQLIKSRIIEENKLEVTEDEVLEHAKEVARMQFAQYGITYVPDEQLEGYAREILKRDDDRKKLYEKKFEDKVVEFIKDQVKVEEKQVTTEEFNKLFT